MANVQIEITRLEFLFKEEITICNLHYVSSEPGAPGWGGGWKTKTYGKSTPAIEILQKDVADYIMWADGREE